MNGAPVDSRTIDEITQAILEHGYLDKQEIVSAWRLGADAYKALQDQLRLNRLIEIGPRKTGGFRAKPLRSREREVVEEQPLLRSEWERTTVERLTELFSHAELETLLGSLLHTIRQARKAQTGEDRRGGKSDLATALTLQHGTDLLAESEVRKLVAKRCGLKYPERWHPGKATAAEFAIRAGFSAELAGVPSNESPPDMEYLEGRFKLEPLQPFQREVMRGILDTFGAEERRCLVTLPTGAGKTRVAVESISFWLTDHFDRETGLSQVGTVLWLAHTEELCEQACSCFRQVWTASDLVCPATLVRFWGGYTSDLIRHQAALRDLFKKPCVLVSTPQRMLNLITGSADGGKEVLESLLPSLGLIAIDEAHRTAAPMYRRLLATLRASETPPTLIGLTATPFTKEYVGSSPDAGTKELHDVFHRLVEPLKTLGLSPRLRLQEMEILAEPLFEELKTPTKIKMTNEVVSGSQAEESIASVDDELRLKTDNTPRRLAVLERLIEICKTPGSSILYFGPSVRDAECMAYLLRNSRISAAVISGNTREASRRQIISDFKNGTIQVLCNCEVLTTGFDAPRVTHVVVARPTVSRVLYEQMVGRGLRGLKFGGTSQCSIVDCKDEFSGPRPEMGYESFRRIWYTTLALHLEFPDQTKAQSVIPQPPSRPQSESPLPSYDPRVWEALAAWSRAGGHFEGWKTDLFDETARLLTRSVPMPAREAKYAALFYLEALAKGFDPRGDYLDQRQLFANPGSPSGSLE